LYFVYLITLPQGEFSMKRSTNHSCFVLITVLSNNSADDGLAGDSCAVSVLSVSISGPLNFQCLSSFDVTPIKRREHILNCTQIGRSFGRLNGYPDYYEMAKDDFGFMSPYGPVHGMVRWTRVNDWDHDKAQGGTLRPTNISI